MQTKLSRRDQNLLDQLSRMSPQEQEQATQRLSQAAKQISQQPKARRHLMLRKADKALGQTGDL